MPAKSGKPEKKLNPLQKMKEDAYRKQQDRIDQIEKDTADLVIKFQDEGYTFEVAMAQLEQARQVAVARQDAGAMCVAINSMSKLAGLWVDRSAVLHAHVTPPNHLHGDTPEQLEASTERLNERLGSANTAKLIAFMKAEGMIRGAN